MFYEFLQQWLLEFPELSNRTVTLFGESFGTPYVSHIAPYILQQNQQRRPGYAPVALHAVVFVSGWVGTRSSHSSHTSTHARAHRTTHTFLPSL